MQQSAPAAQRLPFASQAQRPPAHRIWPQHCRSVVHVPPASAQQRVVVGEARHESPVQQEAMPMHALPAAVHIDVRVQVPIVQVRPAAHGEPVVQHGCVSAPQVVIPHIPPVHEPAMQAVPQ